MLGSDEELVLNEVDRKMLEAKLYEVIKKLKLRERTVLAMRFGLPMGRRKTQKEIAKSLGISRSTFPGLKKIAEEFRQVFSLISWSKRIISGKPMKIKPKTPPAIHQVIVAVHIPFVA